VLYNSFTKRQLDDMVYGWFDAGRLVRLPYSTKSPWDNVVYRCTYKCSGTGKYAQAHLLKAWKDKWARNGDFVPEVTKVTVHLVFWRWYNQGKLLEDGLEISHCWKDRNDVLYLCQETPEMNESRKFCMLFDWWHPVRGRRGGGTKCNHHPPCWGDL